VGVSRYCPNFLVYRLISGTGEATDFKFCRNIHRVGRKFGTKGYENVGKWEL